MIGSAQTDVNSFNPREGYRTSKVVRLPCEWGRKIAAIISAPGDVMVRRR